MALFRMAFFRLFALIFRHFAWRISFFRLFAWRYFVFSLFRLAFFRYFVFSLGVISSWRRAITPGEKTKERNNEMAQTSHHKKTTFSDAFFSWHFKCGGYSRKLLWAKKSKSPFFPGAGLRNNKNN